MGAFTGHTPGSTYGDILQLGNAGAGVPAIPQQVQDGLGNNTGLKVGTTWIQMPSGRVRMTTSPTNVTATMANLTDLTMTLLAGRKYTGTLVLFGNNSTVGEGLQFDLGGGSATFTSIEFGFMGAPPGVTVGVASSVAFQTALTATTVTTTDVAYAIAVGMVVNAAGTIIPRFAEVSHTSGTATVKLCSYFSLDDSAN